MNPHFLMNLPAWRACGWTILHFAWAGAAIGLAGLLARRLVRRAGPETRYAAALCCLIALAAAPAAIAWTIAPASWNDAPEIGASAATASFAPPPGPRADFALPREAVAATPRRLTDRLDDLAKYLPWAWLAGSSLTLALLAGGLVGAERLRLDCRVLTEGEHVARLARLAAEIGIKGRVSLALCDRLAAPLLLGIARPLIALPLVALAGWSPHQLEMVLLHELAHVRRRDNLVNLLQRLVESLLFFHPAVWWASAWVRAEREHCCDALVIARTGRPRAYAEVLLALAPATAPRPLSSPLACRINESPLVQRVRRILNLPEAPMSPRRLATALALAALVAPLTLVAFAGPDKSANSKESEEVLRLMRESIAAIGPVDDRLAATTRLARAEFAAGHRDEAVAILLDARDQAAKLKPGEGHHSPHVLSWIAQAQETIGDRDGALESLRIEARVAGTPSIRRIDDEVAYSENLNLFESIVVEQLKLGAIDDARKTAELAERFENAIPPEKSKDHNMFSTLMKESINAASADVETLLSGSGGPNQPEVSASRKRQLVLIAAARGTVGPHQQEIARRLGELASKPTPLPPADHPEYYNQLNERFSFACEVALAQAQVGYFGEAMETARAINDERLPGVADSSHRFNKAKTIQEIAVLINKAGHPDEARSIFAEAAELACTIQEPGFTIGRLGQIAEAQNDLGDLAGEEQTARRQDPSEAIWTLLRIAQARAKGGDRDAAAKMLVRVRELLTTKGAGGVFAPLQRVHLACESGELDAATKLADAIPGDPADPDARLKRDALTMVALARARTGDLESAKALAGRLTDAEARTELFGQVAAALAEAARAGETR
ncbi:M56 family metallopeptidase [Isosphaeraceae bacterium EP7]